MRENLEEKNPYQQYLESGGAFNEKDYENAIQKVRDAMEMTTHEMPSEQEKPIENQAQHQLKTMVENETPPEKHAQLQVKMIAEYAGIELNKDKADQRAVLYGILRDNSQSKETQSRYSQMSDQRLFAEALRMLEDKDALNKLIEANHKIGTHCPICSKVVTPGESCR